MSRLHASSLTDYRDQPAALLTRHGKQAWIAPPLEAALGCRIIPTDAYDTDQLGTFTRDLKRPGSQLEAARRKARLAMDLLGTSIGLGSEGAFDVDPYTGLMPWNVEMVVWLDLEQNLEVVGLAQGPARNLHTQASGWSQLLGFAQAAGFPEHHVALRPAHADHPMVFKGLNDEALLRSAFLECLKNAANDRVFAESDLRAFCNPTRQALIIDAACDLARKLSSPCPVCATPGYWMRRSVPGLPCGQCGTPSRIPCAHVWACSACGHEHQQPEAMAAADPSRCDRCNP